MVSRMKKLIKNIFSAGLALSITASMAVTTYASEPYVSYNYDAWGDVIESQSGYRVDKTITGYEMELSKLADPNSDLFIRAEEPTSLSGASDIFYEEILNEFWIADSGNNRIIRTDANLKVIGCYDRVTGLEASSDEEARPSTFANPTGIYVTIVTETTKDKKTNKDIEIKKPIIYIADNENARVVKAEIESNKSAKCIFEYTMPDSELYKNNSETFNPSKVLVDSSGILYVVVKSVTTGAVVFDETGEFTGFYGANRVELTAAVIRQAIWRKFASNAQIAAMARNVPVEYANFDIDNEGFIYTVTEAANASTDAVKKLNPAGNNIWNTATGNEYEFGDLPEFADCDTSKYSSRLTDIVVGNDGLINILDYETGRIFQYTQDNDLLFIFGSKNNTSDQKGTFTAPNGIEVVDKNIYVIDGKKNDITIFVETTFGKYVHEAAALFEKGLYEEAIDPWNEVIKRDGGYSLAYYGLGKAYLNTGDYDKAMEYFKISVAKSSYDRAYQYSRDEFLRNHFTAIIVTLFVIIVAIIVIKKLIKKGKIKLPKIRKKPEKEGE